MAGDVADDGGLLAVVTQEAGLHAARYFQALTTILSGVESDGRLPICASGPTSLNCWRTADAAPRANRTLEWFIVLLFT
jgi:hypothetical protein